MSGGIFFLPQTRHLFGKPVNHHGPLVPMEPHGSDFTECSAASSNAIYDEFDDLWHAVETLQGEMAVMRQYTLYADRRITALEK